MGNDYVPEKNQVSAPISIKNINRYLKKKMQFVN